MPELATPLPCRQAELVSWPAGNNGHFLIRNRKTGETFQLGEPEHFLLEQLDGRHDAEQLYAAFAERFGEALAAEELAEFLELADGRGFLQPDGATAPVGKISNPSERLGGLQIRPTKPPPLYQRRAARLLSVVAGVIEWLSGLLDGWAQRMRWFRLSRLDYVPRADDVFIVTYPRSGTTWMQMILYQLTSDGSTDIPHIAEYCPWFERSLRSRLGFETRPSPRVFKSHLRYRQIPKGPGKYVYVARDGKDVAVSCYHHYRNYNGYEGTFAEFFAQFLRGKVEFGSWFQHVREWWAHRHDPNVLFLTYEELTRDLEGCVRKISAFCEIDVPPERLPAILERCRFAFMKQHESKFDPALETLWEQGVQLNSFLRNGRVGEGAIQLSSEQEARYAEVFGHRLAETGITVK